MDKSAESKAEGRVGDFDPLVWRARFPVFSNKVYLNSCSYGALADSVRAAYDDYLGSREQEGSYWDHWVAKNEELRVSLARLLGASPSEIAITASLSAGLNALASAFDFSGERNKVVISDFEFPTVGQIWRAQEARGAEVHIARPEGGLVPLEAFEGLIDDRTAVVSLTHICYRNGARNDIAAIAELAHRFGARVMLDSYQAIGTFPINPGELGADFLAGGVLKYLLGSAGLAFLYVREELIADMSPTTTGWFAQRDIFAMDHRVHDPAPDARRFEMGTPPIPNVYAALAGLEIIHEVGIETIEAHLIGLTTLLINGAKERGFTLATPERADQHGAMIAIRAKDMVEMTARLEAENIVISYRDNCVRISPHFYNSADDIAAVLNALERNRDLLV